MIECQKKREVGVLFREMERGQTGVIVNGIYAGTPVMRLENDTVVDMVNGYVWKLPDNEEIVRLCDFTLTEKTYPPIEPPTNIGQINQPPIETPMDWDGDGSGTYTKTVTAEEV